MSSSCIISCLAMRNTRRLRRSGRSVRKLYQIQVFMARNRQKRRHCRRRPRRRQFPSWIRRRRAARTKARKPGAAATSRRKRPVMLRKHRRMTFLSRKAVRTVRMHQRKMRGRAVRQSLAVLRRISGRKFWHRREGEWQRETFRQRFPEWKQCTGK